MPYPYNYGYNAYGNYNTYGFGGYPQYQPTPQMPQQPVVQNAQQTAPTVQPQITNPSTIIWVKNQQEAAMYPIAPNNAVALWDSASPSIYLKQADASGKPSMKIYDLVERTETPSEAANESSNKSPAYATKDELGAVVGVVKGFDELIGSLKSDIDTIKGDMYGIAGKKKAAKKVKDDAEEDDD